MSDTTGTVIEGGNSANPEEVKEEKKVRNFRAGNISSSWRCPQGHILGYILREKSGGNIRHRLLKLPLAVVDEDWIAENTPCSKIDEGEICCTKCGKARVFGRAKTHSELSNPFHLAGNPRQRSGKKKNRNG